MRRFVMIRNSVGFILEFCLLFYFPILVHFHIVFLFLIFLEFLIIKKYENYIKCTLTTIIFGIIHALSFYYYFYFDSQVLKKICLYFWVICNYHFYEFIFVTISNRNFDQNSFLLNDRDYWVAMSFMLTEYSLHFVFFPNLSLFSFLKLSKFGLFLIFFGDYLRKFSIFWCGPGFTHLLADYKPRGAILVTTGPYAIFRHPGYVGWIVWVLGFYFFNFRHYSLFGCPSFFFSFFNYH